MKRLSHAILQIFRMLMIMTCGNQVIAADALLPSQASQQIKVASLNLCLDELLVLLAEPTQITSVTWLVKDAGNSWYAPLAQGIPSNSGQAEELILQRPDVVIAASYAAPATVNMLDRFGIQVVRFASPTSLSQMRKLIIELGELLGQQRRAQDVVDKFDSKLAGLPPPDFEPSAVLLLPNGLTATAGTFIDDVFRVAGVRNIAVEEQWQDYAQIPLEAVIAVQPDVLVLAQDNPEAPSLAQALLSHPALQQSMHDQQILRIPRQVWTCASPNVIYAIEKLRTLTLGQEALSQYPLL